MLAHDLARTNVIRRLRPRGRGGSSEGPGRALARFGPFGVAQPLERLGYMPEHEGTGPPVPDSRIPECRSKGLEGGLWFAPLEQDQAEGVEVVPARCGVATQGAADQGLGLGKAAFVLEERPGKVVKDRRLVRLDGPRPLVGLDGPVDVSRAEQRVSQVDERPRPAGTEEGRAPERPRRGHVIAPCVVREAEIVQLLGGQGGPRRRCEPPAGAQDEEEDDDEHSERPVARPAPTEVEAGPDHGTGRECVERRRLSRMRGVTPENPNASLSALTRYRSYEKWSAAGSFTNKRKVGGRVPICVA